jgi:hypothetical protein
MKKFRELSEAIKDKFDIGEYDQEGDMAKSDLRSILANAKRVHDMLEDDDNLPEWVQSKITKAEDYMSTVANYMEAEMNEEVELDEVSSYTKIGKLVRKFIPGQGVKQAGERAKDQKYSAGLDRAALQYHPDDKKLATTMKSSEKAQKRYDRISRGESPFKPSPNDTGVKEEVETLEEKNKPTNPELWSRAIALAKSKFDVYPSAYANGWASKWYKSKGGGWRTVSEAKEDNLPFTPDAPKKKSVVVGKKPEGYSIARQLARRAMQSQIEKLKKPVKEETHKAKIVKDIMKKKKDSSENAFQNEPELSSTLTKGF